MDKKSQLQVLAYDYLKEQILTGKLDPDTIHSETRIAAEIGVSRTPMREAIQCLSQDGYIRVIPSKGFVLRQLNEKDMEETIQIRCAIEGFCVHLIAAEGESKRGKKTLAALDKLLDRQKKVLNGKNYDKRFIEYDHQFHLTIVNYAQNQEFQQIFQRLIYLIHLTSQEALAVPGRVEDTLKEHELIYSYLQKGDGDAAYKLLMLHLMIPLTMHLTEKPGCHSEENKIR